MTLGNSEMLSVMAVIGQDAANHKPEEQVLSGWS